MKYDKKNIMKKAWTLYNMSKKWVASCQKSFASCLRQAWAEAKKAAEQSAKLDKLAACGGFAFVNLCKVFINPGRDDCGRSCWYLSGSTYPVRKEIKRAGFEWNPEMRAWYTNDKAVVSSFIGL